MLTHANIFSEKTSTKILSDDCDDNMVTTQNEQDKKLLLKNKMLTHANIKSEKMYFCAFCDYRTIRRYNFDRHLLSSKHSSVTAKTSKTSTKTSTHVNSQNETENIIYHVNVTDNDEELNKIITPQQKLNEAYKCPECSKDFLHRSSLSRHRQKCQGTAIVEVSEPNSVYMKKLEDLEAKIDTLAENTPKANNIYMTVNNEIKNISIFLSKNCKDAMNMSDFISNVNITSDDVNYTLANGYADGMTQLLSKHLNDLKITERPIHCSDKKRLKFYIKDEDKWSLDDNGECLSQSISTLSNKQILSIKDWSNSLIDISNRHEMDSYQQMVSTLCDSTDKKALTKIKKKISTMIGI